MAGANWIKSALDDEVAKGDDVDGADTFSRVLALLFPLDFGGGGGGVNVDVVKVVDGFAPEWAVAVGTGPEPPVPRLGGGLFWLLIVLLEDLLPRFVSCMSISTGTSCAHRSCMLPRETGELKEDVVDDDTNRASVDFDVLFVRWSGVLGGVMPSSNGVVLASTLAGLMK